MREPKIKTPLLQKEEVLVYQSNYKETEADAFEGSGAKVSDYYKPRNKDATRLNLKKEMVKDF